MNIIFKDEHAKSTNKQPEVDAHVNVYENCKSYGMSHLPCSQYLLANSGLQKLQAKPDSTNSAASDNNF